MDNLRFGGLQIYDSWNKCTHCKLLLPQIRKDYYMTLTSVRYLPKKNQLCFSCPINWKIHSIWQRWTTDPWPERRALWGWCSLMINHEVCSHIRPSSIQCADMYPSVPLDSRGACKLNSLRGQNKCGSMQHFLYIIF